jgi:hypothetical protein
MVATCTNAASIKRSVTPRQLSLVAQVGHFMQICLGRCDVSRQTPQTPSAEENARCVDSSSVTTCLKTRITSGTIYLIKQAFLIACLVKGDGEIKQD